VVAGLVLMIISGWSVIRSSCLGHQGPLVLWSRRGKSGAGAHGAPPGRRLTKPSPGPLPTAEALRILEERSRHGAISTAEEFLQRQVRISPPLCNGGPAGGVGRLRPAHRRFLE